MSATITPTVRARLLTILAYLRLRSTKFSLGTTSAPKRSGRALRVTLLFFGAWQWL